jgi:antitoxin ParD1/3/4
VSKSEETVRKALQRYKSIIVAEPANHLVIDKIAEDGIAAIERGEFTVVRGQEGSRALLERLNQRALSRKVASAADAIE